MNLSWRIQVCSLVWPRLAAPFQKIALPAKMMPTRYCGSSTMLFSLSYMTSGRTMFRHRYLFKRCAGPFIKGVEVAPKSGFHKGTHVQIALRDNSCVEGWFLPIGQRLLSEEEYLAAKARRDAMAINRKPRKRPAKPVSGD